MFFRQVAWPSGLRRWFKAPVSSEACWFVTKAPVSSEAWVRIPPLPRFFFSLIPCCIYTHSHGVLLFNSLASIYDKTTVMVFSHHSKTTTRQMLNLCIAIMPFTPGLSDLVWKASWECTGSTFVLSSLSGVKTPSLLDKYLTSTHAFRIPYCLLNNRKRPI